MAFPLPWTSPRDLLVKFAGGDQNLRVKPKHPVSLGDFRITVSHVFSGIRAEHGWRGLGMVVLEPRRMARSRLSLNTPVLINVKMQPLSFYTSKS